MSDSGNLLGDQASAYLRAHASDPVDWRPWGARAFREARSLDRPVFLSVGYQSCHWCHVMQRESFRDTDTAKILNSGFVPIKVDRELRPDVDALYMAYVQASTGSGGWPMSVWLTPDGLPIFGGTYFPRISPHERMPSFRDALEIVRRSWVLSRDHTHEVAEEAREFLTSQQEGGFEYIDEATIEAAAAALRAAEDREHGGFGGAPKFPQAPLVTFLVSYARMTGDAEPGLSALRAVLAMLRGGIYDQVGGGLFRYSVDERWLVPHFEKMLYDQGLLLSSLAAVAPYASHDEREELAIYARRTRDFLDGSLARTDGGYFSSLDAEAGGVEGDSYVWARSELAEVLSPAQLAHAETYLGISETGNWERQMNILTRRAGRAAEGTDAPAVDELLASLARVRAHRRQPAVIENTIVSWNALAARGLIEAGAAFDDSELTSAGLRCVEWLVGTALWRRGDVLHALGDPSVSDVRFLEDAAALTAALLAAAGHAERPAYLKSARTIHAKALDRFGCERGFSASAGDSLLPFAVLEQDDSPTPSGVAMLAENALKLHRLSPHDAAYAAAQNEVVAGMLSQLGRTAHIAPALAGHALGVAADLRSTSA